MSIGRILREPLLHFLLIGFALFLYYGHVAPGSGDERRIVVSQAQVDELSRRFQATWNRPPAAQELSGIVDSYISDEILYREGKALGLDRDDPVIKRRVRQKLEVMAEEAGERAAPTDADLSAYLQAHADKFARPAIISFEQLYFDPSKGGADARMNAAKAALTAGRAVAELGESTMLPRTVDREGIDMVTRDFGVGLRHCTGNIAAGTVDWAGAVRVWRAPGARQRPDAQPAAVARRREAGSAT